MKNAFDKGIKSLNDKLGKGLGVKKVEVNYQKTQMVVPVFISQITPNGKRIEVSSRELEFYRDCLGLLV